MQIYYFQKDAMYVLLCFHRNVSLIRLFFVRFAFPLAAISFALHSESDSATHVIESSTWATHTSFCALSFLTGLLDISVRYLESLNHAPRAIDGDDDTINLERYYQFVELLPYVRGYPGQDDENMGEYENVFRGRTAA